MGTATTPDAPACSGDSLPHVYNAGRFLTNYGGVKVRRHGCPRHSTQWRWAGAHGVLRPALAVDIAPVQSPNADTTSQLTYNLADNVTPQRKTFVVDTVSAGDQRPAAAGFGQGRVMAKDSSGSGSNWYRGTASNNTDGNATVYSRVMYEGTVTATDMDRATDAREKSRIGILGTANAYAGSYGRVTSEAIGRDLNPLGRGDGNAYVGGALNLGRIAPALPRSAPSGGIGNSVNNSGCLGCGLSPTSSDPKLGGNGGVSALPGNGSGPTTNPGDPGAGTPEPGPTPLPEPDPSRLYEICLNECYEKYLASGRTDEFAQCLKKCNCIADCIVEFRKSGSLSDFMKCLGECEDPIEGGVKPKPGLAVISVRTDEMCEFAWDQYRDMSFRCRWAFRGLPGTENPCSVYPYVSEAGCNRFRRNEQTWYILNRDECLRCCGIVFWIPGWPPGGLEVCTDCCRMLASAAHFVMIACCP